MEVKQLKIDIFKELNIDRKKWEQNREETLIEIFKNLINSKKEYVLDLIIPQDDFLLKAFKLKEILKFLEDFHFQTKAKDIQKIKGIKKYTEDLEKYLKDYEYAKKMNIAKNIIYYLFGENKKREFTKELKAWNTLEKMIKDNNVGKKFPKQYKKLLLKYFIEKNNKKIVQQIFSEKEIVFFINKNDNLINEIKKKPSFNIKFINDSQKPKEKKYINIPYKIIKENIDLTKAELILHNEIKFNFFNAKQSKEKINIIFNSGNIIEISFEEVFDKKFLLIKKEDETESIKNYKNYYLFLEEFEYLMKENEKDIINDYSIHLFIKKINNIKIFNFYNISCKYLIQSNGKTLANFEDNNILINGANIGFMEMIDYLNGNNKQDNNKDETKSKTGINNEINIINIKSCFNFSKINEFKDKKDRDITILNIFQKNKGIFLIKTNKDFYIFDINKNKIIGDIEIKIKDSKSSNKILGNNCIIYHQNNQFNIIKSSEVKDEKETNWINCVPIDESNFAFINNKSQLSNEKEIFFYNIEDESIITICSFSNSLNNNILLTIDYIKEEKIIKILLIPCKNENKNGILIAIPQIENQQCDKIFLETLDLEIDFLFNNLSKLHNDNDIYIFAYGFDHSDKQRKIILYKILFNDILTKIKIIYIKEIEIKGDKNWMKKEIKLIKQSEKGNIIILCKNGIVYSSDL